MRSTNTFTLLKTIALCILLSACQSTPEPTKKVDAPEILHQDSTVYFADKKASVSMRASFIQRTIQGNQTDPLSQSTTTQLLNGGYQLQFRSIDKGNNSIEDVSVVAGGKKFSLSTTSLLIPQNKWVILGLTEEESLFIAQQSDATLRFRYNQTSYLMSIRNHTLSEFIIPL